VANIVFKRLERQGFDLAFTYHADAILNHDFPEAVQELERTLRDISIPITELIKGGGGETLGTQRLRRALTAENWSKRIFHVQVEVDDRATSAQSHEVDHVKVFDKGTIALEIEWNNKDPFFDRDLDNFNRLHANGAISIGIIITRGSSLQAEVEARIRKFARSHHVNAFEDLDQFGIQPTRRQRAEVELCLQRQKCSFADGWAMCFVRDKFGGSTTHWSKLKTRLDRGVGSPCPFVAIGLPIGCIVDE
jgi:hypothetical protein